MKQWRAETETDDQHVIMHRTEIWTNKKEFKLFSVTFSVKHPTHKPYSHPTHRPYSHPNHRPYSHPTHRPNLPLFPRGTRCHASGKWQKPLSWILCPERHWVKWFGDNWDKITTVHSTSKVNTFPASTYQYHGKGWKEDEQRRFN